MTIGDIIVLAVIVLIVGFAVKSIVKKHKNGSS